MASLSGGGGGRSSLVHALNRRGPNGNEDVALPVSGVALVHDRNRSGPNGSDVTAGGGAVLSLVHSQ